MSGFSNRKFCPHKPEKAAETSFSDQFPLDFSMLGNGFRNVFYTTEKDEKLGKIGQITLLGYDKEGNPATFKFPYRVSVAYSIVGDTGETGEVNLYGEPLRRKWFNTSYERKQWLKAMEESKTIRIIEAFPPEDSFIMDAFRHRIYDEDYNDLPLRVYFYDIECAVENKFPYPEETPDPINIITILDSIDKKYFSWALSDKKCDNTLGTYDGMPIELFKFGNEKRRVDLEYKLAKNEITEDQFNRSVKESMLEDEKKMLRHFVSWVSEHQPDVWSGWNCINVNSNVWLRDRISTIGNLSQDSKLFDSNLVRIFPRTIKDEYRITLDNGNEIFTSKDHIFPVRFHDNEKYVCYNKLTEGFSDKPVNDIINKLNSGNTAFVKVGLRKNDAKPLTWRRLILNHTETFVNSCDIVFSDYSKVKIDYTKSKTKQRAYSRIKDTITIDEVREYVSNHDIITVYLSENRKLDIDLDQEIDNELLHILGIIYTDGCVCQENTYDVISIYNTNIPMLNRIADRIDRYKKSGSKRRCFGKKSKGVYRYRIDNTTPISLLLPMIYERGEKKLNIEVLSELSRSQFLAFFSGLIDGDGWVTKNNNEIGFCNYNGDIRNVHELLLWNGVFSTISQNWLRIGVNDIPSILTSVDFWVDYKSDRISRYAHTDGNRNSSAHAEDTKLRIYDGYAIVKIRKIEKTGKKVEMLDIETDTHYFYANGIKTHNCRMFDMPYIIKRIEKVLGKKWATALCPGGYYREKKLIFEEEEGDSKKMDRNNTVIIMSGVSQMDLKVLYKDKFKIRQALDGGYNLNNVSLVELDDEKVKHEEGFNNFWKVNFQRYWEYNVQDVSLVYRIEEKLGLITQARSITSIGSTNMDSIYQSINYIMQSLAMFSKQKFSKTWLTASVGGKKKGEKYTGAFVFDVQAGIYRYGEGTVDFNSLYPNTGRSLNLSPETKMAVVFGNWDDPDEQLYIVPNERVWQVSPETKQKLLTAQSLGQPGIKLSRKALAKILDEMCCNSVAITRKSDGAIYHVLFKKYEVQKGIFSEWLGFYFDKRKALKKVLAEWEDKADAIEESVRKEISSKSENNDKSVKEINKLVNVALKANEEHRHCLNMADRYDHLQQATKILINSAYGTLGTPSSPIYDVELAETITLNGQFTNKSAAKKIAQIYRERYGASEDFIPQLSGDTDSVTGNMKVDAFFSDELRRRIESISDNETKE